MPRNPTLFLDTSVILAAVFSSRGGSAGILDLVRKNFLKIIITEAVVIEAHRKIQKKYGVKELATLEKVLTGFQASIKSTPPKAEWKKFDKYITDQDDRHILASADIYTVDYLVTLDKKHFFTEEIGRVPSKFKIHTPHTFLTDFREFLEGD